jgi:hypothetical protein
MSRTSTGLKSGSHLTISIHPYPLSELNTNVTARDFKKYILKIKIN